QPKSIRVSKLVKSAFSRDLKFSRIRKEVYDSEFKRSYSIDFRKIISNYYKSSNDYLKKRRYLAENYFTVIINVLNYLPSCIVKPKIQKEKVISYLEPTDFGRESGLNSTFRSYLIMEDYLQDPISFVNLNSFQSSGKLFYYDYKESKSIFDKNKIKSIFNFELLTSDESSYVTLGINVIGKSCENLSFYNDLMSLYEKYDYAYFKNS
ncbi:unnamed protein product, partial [Brachionus calyciflorus]